MCVCVCARHVTDGGQAAQIPQPGNVLIKIPKRYRKNTETRKRFQTIRTPRRYRTNTETRKRFQKIIPANVVGVRGGAGRRGKEGGVRQGP